MAITTPEYARHLLQRFPLCIQGRYNPQASGVAVASLHVLPCSLACVACKLAVTQMARPPTTSALPSCPVQTQGYLEAVAPVLLEELGTLLAPFLKVSLPFLSIDVLSDYVPCSIDVPAGCRLLMLACSAAAVPAATLLAQGGRLPPTAHVRAQRWGRGFVRQPLGVPCLAAPQQRFAACGDYCLGNSIEDAWLSGRAAAEEVEAALVW